MYNMYIMYACCMENQKSIAYKSVGIGEKFRRTSATKTKKVRNNERRNEKETTKEREMYAAMVRPDCKT